MMSEQLLPSACEVDIVGVLAMYALQLASGTPSALVDWNNNYAGDPDKCVFFHCKQGFEHHVAMTRAHVADVLKEAFETYLGWETYQHPG